MKLFGVGTDIIQVNRLKKSLNKKPFLSRIYSKEEILKCKRSKVNSNCFAKRFAAKEALFKAIGASNKLSFKDVEIVNNSLGAPKFKIKGLSLINLKKLFKNKKFKVHLSLSDDKPWAMASVIVFLHK